MKIILSRKGFDSSYGKGASPIMPNGDLLSIPIPANEKESGIPYSSIFYEGQSYASIMKDLELKMPKSQSCHLDPDIYPQACKRDKFWQGIFGQHAAAESHLKNQKVEVGDLFLFFGSFKRTCQRKKLTFERDYQRHIIFGFLKIGKILQPSKDKIPPQFNDHPHVKNKELYANKNSLYIANSKEDFGTFKYSKELVLTKNGFPKSYWELPSFFYPTKKTSFSRHSQKDFEKRNNKVILKSRGIGQDFVIRGNEQVTNWAKDLIEKAEKIK